MIAALSQHLPELINKLTPFGMTTTSVVLSTVVPRRVIDPTVAEWKARLKGKGRLQ